MSEATPILECNDVSIRYRVGDFKNIGLKEWVMRNLTGKYKVVDFWADSNVSFSLNEGDMLGIIGTNGAGKSTLLKAVSGIMEPTRGRIVRRGTIAALLELASGFDGDLTVKENTYLRGAMLGYTRAFMDQTYPYIVDFAELKEFEDRPFKQLSSGMKSRLAFAIASLVKPEILILDEVLSVGDGAFNVKSEAKMREIINGGATTILVSHSIAKVRTLCNKILWLDKGRQIVFTDDVEGACDCYEEYLKEKSSGPVYDPVAAKARIDARAAEKARRAEAARKQAEDAQKAARVRELLRRYKANGGEK
jgi:ABC-2 type transport system ATP-binding protein